MKRWIAVGIAVLLVGGVGYAAWSRGRAGSVPAESQIEMVSIERGTLVTTVSGSGSVAPALERTLSFAISGRVIEVLVEEGEEVEEGQVLASLDIADLELQVAQARAVLAQAQASLALLQKGPSEDERALAEAQLELARLKLQQAQGAWDRVSWMPGASARPEGIALQQASVEYRQALANYNLALAGPSEEEIARAQAEVERARAAWQQARLSLERAELVAPFSGVVTQIEIEVGQTASPGAPALQLMDLSSTLIELSIDEIDIAQIAPGQTARVTLDALPGESFRGRIDFIAPAANLESGVVTYPVRVRLEDNNPRLRVGMTADVEIAAQRAEGALLVPNRAIRVDREAGRLYVEKAMASGSLLVEITPGLRNESFTQVLEGLSEGDQVIIRPISGRELLQETFQFGGSR